MTTALVLLAFKGRASIPAYWITICGLIVGYVAIALIRYDIPSMLLEVILSLCMILLGYSSLSLCAARCRDAGWSAWLCAVALIPIIGWGFVIWLGFRPSEWGDIKWFTLDD